MLSILYEYFKYLYNICGYKTESNVDNIEEPLLKFCENEFTTLTDNHKIEPLTPVQSVIPAYVSSLHTIQEYGEEHV